MTELPNTTKAPHMPPSARVTQDPSHPNAAKYDRAYFDRWYRSARWRIDTREALERKVHLAVSAAEYILGRRIRSVLDVGSGEGRWAPVLRSLRPRASYLGVDPSEYAVRRFGSARHIRRGSFGGLRSLRLRPGFDLVITADVLQYVPTREIEQGLREIRRLLAGVAYIEAFAREDDMEGDLEGWHSRSAAAYRRLFHRAGLRHCGLHLWVDPRRLGNLNALELADAGR